MRRTDHRPFAFLLAVALCLTVFVLPAFAAYESDENGGTDPPPYAGTVITIISKEMGDMPEEPEDGGEPESEPTPETEPGEEMAKRWTWTHSLKASLPCCCPAISPA